MRLLRFKGDAGPRLGVLVSGEIFPLDAIRDRYPTMLSIVEGAPASLAAIASLIQRSGPRLALSSVGLLAPIERPGKYLAIGMNYRKHLAEAEKLGVVPPKHQVWFNKQTTCLAGPHDDIDPGVTEKLDYEVELGIVIGKSAKYVKVENASAHIFGYFVANDVSARDWQFHSQTFTIGKSFDTHGPIGPWIVTADEIPDPRLLKLRCLVNGEVRQQNEVSQMINDIAEQITYLSTAFTLDPGDLIATGTPEGVGVGMDPPRFLQPGDVVRCEIDGIGHIENRVAKSGTPVRSIHS